MKKFKFDDAGALEVLETISQETLEGGLFEASTAHVVSAAQLALHLPMFESEMSAEELAHAHAIIAGLNA